MPKKASPHGRKYQSIVEWLNSDPKQKPARRELIGQLREKFEKADWSDLEWIHAVGRLLTQLYPHTIPEEGTQPGAEPKKRPYGESFFELLADHVRPDWKQSNKALDDYLIIAWQFALAYPTKQVLRELLRAGSTAKPPRTLTWQGVRCLLRIKDAKHTRSLVQKWDKHPCSLRELQRETRKVVAAERAVGPEKKYRGRPPTKPTSRREMAEQVRDRADDWLWWYDNLGRPFKIASARVANLDNLSRKLRNRLDAAAGAIQSLKEAAEDEMEDATSRR